MAEINGIRASGNPWYNEDIWKDDYCVGDERPHKDRYYNLEKELESIMQKDKKQTKSEVKMSNFKDKIKSKLIPEKVSGFYLSYDGVICVPDLNDDEMNIGIDSNNEIVSYPDDVCFEIPMLSVVKPISEVKKGDIVYVNNNWAKITSKNGSKLSIIDYNGEFKENNVKKDFIFKENLVKTLVNITNLMGGKSNDISNNLLLLSILGKDSCDDINPILALSMLSNGKTNDNKMNPLVLMSLLDDSDKESSTFEKILMMQALSNGGLSLDGLFGNNTEKKKEKEE